MYIAKLGGLKSSGGRTQAHALEICAQVLGVDPVSLNWAAFRYQHTAPIRARVAASYSPAMANKILSALRQTLKQAWLLGQMSAEDYHRAAEIENVTGETVPAGRELSTDEIKALLDACKADSNRMAGTRDAAIVGIMYAAGLRREEVVNLDASNYEDGKITLVGKRSKEALRRKLEQATAGAAGPARKR